MFGKGKITFQKVSGYYLLIMFIFLGIQFTFYNSIEGFLKSDFVNSSIFILAIIGLLYVATITKLKDILLLKMFDTEKYNEVYENYKMSRYENSHDQDLYLNKYGPLNHFVDMVRACGWTMVLIYPLFIVLKHAGNGLFLNIISFMVVIIPFLALWISTYFIYSNLKVLYRFNK